MLTGCREKGPEAEPSIEFTSIPASEEGSPDKVVAIAGKVRHAKPGQRIVLFARSGIWWVQPTADKPFTAITTDSSWRSDTHPGSAYAALLVDANYRPPSKIPELPKQGGAIAAVLVAEGSPQPDAKNLHFSGYEWRVKHASSSRSATLNFYDPANVSIDKQGRLHLCIEKRQNRWTSAEVSLTRSLGYGSYRFVVDDVTHLEPSAVFTVFMADDTGPREMDIEVSRWGEPNSKNAQFVVQPYYVPANTMRFIAPPGALTYAFNWESGRVAFKTLHESTNGRAVVAEHTFSSGVPAPGNETVRMNLYVYGNERNPLEKSCEVVIEKFEYLP